MSTQTSHGRHSEATGMFNVIDHASGWKIDFISKASGGSERQRRDVAGMLATVGDDLDNPYIERWINELDLSDEWELAKRTQLA